MISSIVLAAGRAENMGEQKLLLPLRGKPLLQWILESALASDLHEIVCVVRDLSAVRRRISLADERLYWIINNAADRGQSTSVIGGLWAIHPKSDGALFLVGDQPMIQSKLIDSASLMVVILDQPGGRVLGLVTLHDLLRAQVVLAKEGAT